MGEGNMIHDIDIFLIMIWNWMMQK